MKETLKGVLCNISRDGVLELQEEELLMRIQIKELVDRATETEDFAHRDQIMRFVVGKENYYNGLRQAMRLIKVNTLHVDGVEDAD